jgi:trigger factor
MSDKTHEHDQETEAQATATAEGEHVHGPDCDHEHEHEGDEGRIKPITIELDDLTAEGKAEAEKQLRRSIPDRPYTLARQESRPGAVVALTFEVSAETFKIEQTALLADLRKEIVLPGFRKGKAPVNLLLKRLGDEASRDTIGALATNVLRQEQARRNWSMLTKPRVKDYDVPEGAGAVKIEIEVETTPTVELKTYKGLEVEVEKHEVDDAAVEARLEEMRRRSAVQEKANDKHEIAEGDTVTVDVEVLNADGERLQHLCRQDQTLHDWRRELPEAVAGRMAGKKAGDTVTARVANKTTNRRGEEVIHEDDTRVTIKEIRVTKLPELDDDFAKDLGDYADLNALRAKVRKDLEEAEEERRRNEGIGKLFREIVEQNPIDVPKSLVAQQQYEMIMQDSYQMQRYGLRLDQVIHDMGAYLRDQQSGADQTVRLQMAVAELTKIEKLEVTEADVDAEIKRMAEESGRKPLAVRAHLEARNQLDQLRQSLSRRKVGDFLMANNKIKLVAPKPPETPEPEEQPKPAKKSEAAKGATAEKPKAEEKDAGKPKAKTAGKPKSEAKPKSAAKPTTAAKAEARPKPAAKAKDKPKKSR